MIERRRFIANKKAQRPGDDEEFVSAARELSTRQGTAGKGFSRGWTPPTRRLTGRTA